MKKRCYHNRNSWIIMGGHAQWCYVCGAYRNLRREEPNIIYPASAWRRPTGNPGNNPWERMVKDDAVFEKRNKR